MLIDILIKWEQKTIERQKQYKNLLQRIDKKKAIKQLAILHDEAFSKIDCLTCANCCKNYSPRFKQPDIKRIAKYMRMKEADFVATYLRRDEDGDFVVTKHPCPFLDKDNFCTIYEVRPSDCERFPYTDEDILFKKTSITLKNSTFCPAVFYVLEKLNQDF